MSPVFRFTHAASAIAAAFLMTTAVTPSFAGSGVPKEVGVWIDDTGKGATRIEVCGTRLCGRIVWLKDLVNDKGENLVDKHNPDPSQRTRPICGLPVIGQLEQMPEGGYDGGWVYDPKVGQSYSVAIVLSGRDQLTVTGYKGVKFLGKSFTWTRAKTELPSCAVKASDAKNADQPAVVAKPSTAKAAASKPNVATAPNANAGDTQPSPVKQTTVKTSTVKTDGSASAPAKKATTATTSTAKPAKKAANTETLPWDTEKTAAKATPKPTAKPIVKATAKPVAKPVDAADVVKTPENTQ